VARQKRKLSGHTELQEMMMYVTRARCPCPHVDNTPEPARKWTGSRTNYASVLAK
jgi:hypothetical protein